jgi:hypothetical protein
MEEFKLVEGINPKCSNEEYHGDREYVSSSVLKLMFKDPKEYYNRYVLGDMTNAPKGASLDFGSYIHARILEPEIVEDEFAIFEGARRAGAVWERFKLENLDKIILTGVQKRKADKLLDKYEEKIIVIDHPEKGTQEVPVSTFFTGGEAEETFATTIDGVKVKVRTDYRKAFKSFGSINDVKTCSEESLTKENLEKVCARWGYDISAALYIDVLTQVLGVPQDFYFLFISTTSGQIEIVKASKQMIENGRRKYKKGLKMLREARLSGVYFKNEIVELESPEWDIYEGE